MLRGIATNVPLTSPLLILSSTLLWLPFSLKQICHHQISNQNPCQHFMPSRIKFLSYVQEQTRLLIAAQKGDIEEVNKALLNGTPVDCKDDVRDQFFAALHFRL